MGIYVPLKSAIENVCIIIIIIITMDIKNLKSYNFCLFVCLIFILLCEYRLYSLILLGKSQISVVEVKFLLWKLFWHGLVVGIATYRNYSHQTNKNCEENHCHLLQKLHLWICFYLLWIKSMWRYSGTQAQLLPIERTLRCCVIYVKFVDPNICIIAIRLEISYKKKKQSAKPDHVFILKSYQHFFVRMISTVMSP